MSIQVAVAENFERVVNYAVRLCGPHCDTSVDLRCTPSFHDHVHIHLKDLGSEVRLAVVTQERVHPSDLPFRKPTIAFEICSLGTQVAASVRAMLSTIDTKAIDQHRNGVCVDGMSVSLVASLPQGQCSAEGNCSLLGADARRITDGTIQLARAETRSRIIARSLESLSGYIDDNVRDREGAL